MLTIEDLKETFESITQTNGFMRATAKHPLELFVGWDSVDRETLLLVCKEKPIRLFSSSMIDVDTGKRKDNKWAISFSLTDSKYFDIFCQFCLDIILSSSDVKDTDEGEKFVCQRYIKWQEMLKRKRGVLLTDSEIKGLIGELYFLKEYLIPNYSISKAILSWVGPKRVDQDFVVDETWYEVKATTSGSESIKVSSIEQLDLDEVGHLAILFLDKTSQANSLKITLNQLVNEIASLVSGTPELLTAFNGELIEQGYYYSEEYDEYCFRFNGYSLYLVDERFQCLRRKDIPKSIKNASYDLLLAELESQKEVSADEC